MPSKPDYSREINALHKSGFTPDEIRLAMLKRGYFNGRSRSFIAGFIRRRIEEIKNARITPTVEVEEILERVRKPVVSVLIIEQEEKKC